MRKLILTIFAFALCCLLLASCTDMKPVEGDTEKGTTAHVTETQTEQTAVTDGEKGSDTENNSETATTQSENHDWTNFY